MTAEQALARHGFDWDRLEKLAWRALKKAMVDRRISLDPAREQEAFELYVDVGARWAIEFDPEKARGQSFSTSCYRRMYPKLTDYLRRRHGDARRGNPIYEQTTATGELPERAALMDEETFEQLVEHIRPRLRGWGLQAIEIAKDCVVLGLPSVVIAKRHNIDPSLVGEYLEGLGHQLGYRQAAA